MASPLNIRKAPKLESRDLSSQAISLSSTPTGTPDLRALRAQSTASGTPVPVNIPPRQLARTGSPATSGVGTPRAGGISSTRPSIGNGTPNASDGAIPDLPTPPPNLEELSEEEKLKVLQRHLVSKEERTEPGPSSAELLVPGSSTSESRRSSTSGLLKPRLEREESDLFPIHYHAPGADVTHDIYKWQGKQVRAGRSRAQSFHSQNPVQPDPALEHIHEPGGFRRAYVLQRAHEEGALEERRAVVLNNFVDFLFVYGHYAGEDLEEIEEETEEEETEDDLEAGAETAHERSALLGKVGRTRSRQRTRSASVGPRGTASVTQAVLILMKGFVGTGILFLGKAFFNGGLLFSSLLFVFIAMISLYSFLLLVDVKFVVAASFGDMGGILYGPWFRTTILTSIVVSQLGFVAAYTIFVAENLQTFVLGVTHCAKFLSVRTLIAIQLVVFLPLCLIRDLAKLSTTALVADAFILAGLVYIFGSEFSLIASRGIADVQMFNPRDFPLFVGTAVFSFEGIGLIIPITDAMREPRKFPAVLTGCMVFLTFLFGGAGALAYLTFGSEIETVVLVNLNLNSKMVQAVQFLYSLAILLSVPLQLFPAVRIMENGLFERSGKNDLRVKWMKNGFRFATVMLCTAISLVGAADLDKFVAFIGSFACVPLCYVYPAMLHYKACARTRKEKMKDIAMIVFGCVAAVYTTVQTVRLIAAPAPGAPTLGHCVPPH